MHANWQSHTKPNKTSLRLLVGLPMLQSQRRIKVKQAQENYKYKMEKQFFP